jgi:hypothetical protein
MGVILAMYTISHAMNVTDATFAMVGACGQRVPIGVTWQKCDGTVHQGFFRQLCLRIHSSRMSTSLKRFTIT